MRHESCNVIYESWWYFTSFANNIPHALCSPTYSLCQLTELKLHRELFVLPYKWGVRYNVSFKLVEGWDFRYCFFQRQEAVNHKADVFCECSILAATKRLLLSLIKKEMTSHALNSLRSKRTEFDTCNRSQFFCQNEIRTLLRRSWASLEHFLNRWLSARDYIETCWEALWLCHLGDLEVRNVWFALLYFFLLNNAHYFL